jgi:antitoxin (DNA-binding transcriptional repressor) of toxin-antitoxin stability system
MKLERLANGNVLIKDDSDKILRVLSSDIHVVRHPQEQAALFTRTPSTQPDAGDGFVLFPSELTDPVVADLDALMLELATNYVYPASGGGGGGGGDASAANQALMIAELSEINTDTDDVINSVTFGSEIIVTTINSTSSQVIASNSNRKAIIITNAKSGKDAYILFGAGTAISEQSMKLKKDSSLILGADLLTTQEVQAVCKGAETTTFVIQEGL